MRRQARLFDKRVIDRNLDKGLITQEDVNDYLTNLPDMESESEPLLLDAEETEEEAEAAEESAEASFNFDTPENEGPKNVYDF